MKAEIPDAMIESRIEELVQDFQYRISQQGLKLGAVPAVYGHDHGAVQGAVP